MTVDEKKIKQDFYEILNPCTIKLRRLMYRIKKNIKTSTDPCEKERLETRFEQIKGLTETILEEKVKILTEKRIHLVKKS